MLISTFSIIFFPTDYITREIIVFEAHYLYKIIVYLTQILYINIFVKTFAKKESAYDFLLLLLLYDYLAHLFSTFSNIYAEF
jgi:hypothetical protein